MTLSARKAVLIGLAITAVVSTGCQDTTEPVVSGPSFHILPPPPGGYYQYCRRWPQGGTATRWSDELQWTTGPCAVQVSSSPGTMMSATNPQTMTFQFTGPVLNVTIHTNGAFPLPCPTVTLTARAYNGETLVDSASFVEGCSGRTSDGYHNAGPITKLVITPPEPMPSTGAQFYVHYYVPCPPTGDPVMDDEQVQRALASEWAMSVSENRERGGWIYRDDATGQYVVRAEEGTYRDRCQIDYSSIPPAVPGLTPVRAWHTHILQPGTKVGPGCRDVPADKVVLNGPSQGLDEDRGFVLRSGYPHLLLDLDQVFPIAPDFTWYGIEWPNSCRNTA